MQVPQTSRTFRQTDPAQLSARGLISDLNDMEIVDLENDLDSYVRSGVMTSRLKVMLNSVEEAAPVAA